MEAWRLEKLYVKSINDFGFFDFLITSEVGNLGGGEPRRLRRIIGWEVQKLRKHKNLIK
jgi:hypothetical protein